MIIMKKFVEGQIYDFADWFSKEIYRYTVVSVGNETVWFDVQLKGSTDKVMVEKVIYKDDRDDEYVLLYIYQDNEARIYADTLY